MLRTEAGACRRRAAPRSLLLGTYDNNGHFRQPTTTLDRTARSTFADLFTPSRRGHPWRGWSFRASRGSREQLAVRLVEPVVVAEVTVDAALDRPAAGATPCG
ncbi:hypothetical protein [Streptomyces phaeochromogenes]|uniref:hypothetical protein n=1 Tax=Streptomyces phaeochromogenes TaxID=1923 RepID=UPI0033E51DDE|nr:hypothetical protein OG277_01260 [Streptomyces phaeochromogenes]WTA01363.1 hypothetical protein OHB08_02965 [Streptomyces phaeochromogenes]